MFTGEKKLILHSSPKACFKYIMPKLPLMLPSPNHEITSSDPKLE